MKTSGSQNDAWIKRFDYIQQVKSRLSPLPQPLDFTQKNRILMKINGIGRKAKSLRSSSGKIVKLPYKILCSGLYANQTPLSFLVQGQAGKVSLCLGTWTFPNNKKNFQHSLNNRLEQLNSVLKGLYPYLEIEPINDHQKFLNNRSRELGSAPCIGLVRGHPSTMETDAQDGATSMDRLFQAMSSCPDGWAFLVLAEPVPETLVRHYRTSLFNEMRAIQFAIKAEEISEAFGKNYTRMLQVAVQSQTEGITSGAWKTAVYLLGSRSSYYQLSSVWKSLFTGKRSKPEPVRIWEIKNGSDLAKQWIMPSQDSAMEQVPNGCMYRHPFDFQTLLNSKQLSAYINFPQLETPGFTIHRVPDFDLTPPKVKQHESIATLGTIQHFKNNTKIPYSVSLENLKKHVFVAGVTGSGKTRTIFHLLTRTDASKIPFLIIEPSKTEYRELIHHLPDVKVFTLGNETIAPLRINPFEVLDTETTPVGVHLDLLRSLFSASFGMWTPQPQVLEKSLHQIYRDRGWDVLTNNNPRIYGVPYNIGCFPTLSDLISKVDSITDSLGYDPEAESRIKAALKTRLNGLRTGGKGRMLDVQRSIPMSYIFESQVVLELEHMGDDDDKAFMMGLILILLSEYRRYQYLKERKENSGDLDKLKHLLVIEEAHRLLANISTKGKEEEANPRGKAVESFSNLLSEVRALGQGIIISDQVPVKLSPDVIKNTNLKLVHRIVSEDDRKVLSGSMGMNERQSRSLATLRSENGDAVAFSEGDDAPVLIKIPKPIHQHYPGNSELKSNWKKNFELKNFASFYTYYPNCIQFCIDKSRSNCLTGRDISEHFSIEEAFSIFITSLIGSCLTYGKPRLINLIDKSLCDFKNQIAHFYKGTIDDAIVLHCTISHLIEIFFRRIGECYQWAYKDEFKLKELAAIFLSILLKNTSKEEAVEKATIFSHTMREMCSLKYDPFYGCDKVCPSEADDHRICFFRYQAGQVLKLKQFAKDYYDCNYQVEELYILGTMNVTRLINFNSSNYFFHSAALCPIIQKVYNDNSLDPQSRKTLIDQIVDISNENKE